MPISVSPLPNRRWPRHRRYRKAETFSSASKTTTKKPSFRWRDEFVELGFGIIATSGTWATLQAAGIPVQKVFKLREGRPNVFDRVINGDINFIVNTPSGKIPREDEVTDPQRIAGARKFRS